MPEESPDAPLIQLVRLLKVSGVEFMIIGRQAEVIFGSPRITYHIDLCYRRSAQNLEKLAAVLRALHPRLRRAPPDLPFVLDARSPALGSNFSFTTDLGDLDLLGFVEPFGAYDQLAPRAETYRIGDIEVNTISLDDLIKAKQAIRRAKDGDSLLQLLAIKKARDMGKGK